MSKRKTKVRNQQVFDDLLELRQSTYAESPDEDSEDDSRHAKNNMMKKFRFQLLHEWLVKEFPACRAADIGGGKGLLAYLLRESGWDATVIDPVFQELPHKYKDFHTKKRVFLAKDAKAQRISQNFNPMMARNFDLLIGLHAHGCNIQIIDSSLDYGCGFVLLPCCVIDEPLYPRRGATWIGALTDYALRQGFDVKPFRLAFAGQNIGIYAAPKLLPPYEETEK